MSGYDPLRQWEQEFLNQPRICSRCGGLGKVRRLVCCRWRTCPACHGTGGAIDDDSAWRRAAQR